MVGALVIIEVSEPQFLNLGMMQGRFIGIISNNCNDINCQHLVNIFYGPGIVLSVLHELAC